MFGCYSGDQHQPLDGNSTASTEISVPQESAVSYADVKPIFEAQCARCHPAWSPPNWLDATAAREYIQNGKLAARALGASPTMPMLGSPEADSITQVQRDLLKAWIDGGGL